MFTAPTMCKALRQLSPGSVPGQLRQAELSMRQRDEPVDRSWGRLPRKQISPVGLQAHVQGALGTQLPLEAGRASAHLPIVSRTSGRNSIHSGCTELPSASLSTCRPQGTFSGPLGDNQELFVHSLQGTGTFHQSLSAFAPINYRMGFT